VHWGGSGGNANRAAYFEPFAKETGIKIIEEVGPSMEKVKAQVDAGNVTWDVLVSIGAFRMYQGVKLNLLEPIDYNVVTNTKTLLNGALQPYGVFSEVSSWLIAYNNKKLAGSKHPGNWAEFWDVKGFPGHRSMQNLVIFTLETALLADGVQPDKLYPLDIDRAFRKLAEIKPHIDVWATNYEQPIKLLVDGEVDLTHAINARTTEAIGKGAPISVEWNQGIISYDCWAVPKGASNKKAAMEFINFCLAPERQAHYVTLYSYGPINREALPLLPSAVRNNVPTSPGILERQVPLNDQFWADNLGSLGERFSKWLAQN
jgi:putative spermidine/putrescine transport system substrate-binding protein